MRASVFTRSVIARLAAVLFLTVAAAAQGYAQDTYSHWELGGDIGYGVYRNGTISANGATAAAGIRNGFAAGAVLGEDLYEHFSGELRYEYQDGHPFLSSGGVAREIQGQSHTITYEFLVHLKRRESRFRPFAAGGVGGKDYAISGSAPNPQPLPTIATLNNVDVWRFVVSAGGGVKVRLASHVLARFDFRDYITQFPKRQLAPAANGTARGIFQQFTPMFGLSYIF